MREVHKSNLAEADLIGIWRHTFETWGEGQADLYLDQVEAALLKIAAGPGTGRDCSDIKPGYWKAKSGRHVIFYTFDAQELFVVRVLHDRMDFDRHL